MPRTIKIAVVQMDATPAPVDHRLERASKVVDSAVDAGAQLIVLPELFNIGYTYSEENYASAETESGMTVTWMKQTASDKQVYITGSLLLREQDHVYNTAYLIAPDGQMWRYDKHYPFLWERAYFREGNHITVAETKLGKLGLMICWDSAHPELWERYAGNVDAMLIVSCPPMFNKAQLVFPDGQQLPPSRGSSHFADGGIHEQAKWMHVPVVHSSGHGTFESSIPVPSATVAWSALYEPDMFFDVMQQASNVKLETKFGYHTQIIDADGSVMARVTQGGDAFAVATVELADMPPQPDSIQPRFDYQPHEYFMIDILSDIVYGPVYQRGLRRQWGARMAPTDEKTKVWSFFTIISLIVGVFVGLIFSKKQD